MTASYGVEGEPRRRWCKGCSKGHEGMHRRGPGCHPALPHRDSHSHVHANGARKNDSTRPPSLGSLLLAMRKPKALPPPAVRKLEALKAEYEAVKGVSAPKGMKGNNADWLTEQIKAAKAAAAAKAALAKAEEAKRLKREKNEEENRLKKEDALRQKEEGLNQLKAEQAAAAAAAAAAKATEEKRLKREAAAATRLAKEEGLKQLKAAGAEAAAAAAKAAEHKCFKEAAARAHGPRQVTFSV